MKKSTALFIVAIGFYSTLAAECCFGPEAGAEYLFFRPSFDNLQYVVVDPRPYAPPPTVPAPGLPQGTEQYGPIGNLKELHPSYHSGFRAMLGLWFCEKTRDIRAIYTWLHTTDSKTVRPTPGSGGLWAIGVIEANVLIVPPYEQTILFNSGSPTSIDALAKSSLKLQYDAVDLQLGMRQTVGCDLWARGYIGVHFVNWQHTFNTFYQGAQHPGVTPATNPDDYDFLARTINAQVRRSGRAWGIGPRLGGEVSYDIWSWFGVTGRLAGALLTCERQAKYFQFLFGFTPATDAVSEDFNWDVSTDWEWVVVPEIEARVGLKFHYCFAGCLPVSAEIGYEFISYIDFVPVGPFFREDKQVSLVRCSSFNLHGLYVAFRGRF